MNFKHITNSLKDIVSEHLFPVTKVETVETAKPTLPDETLKLIFVNEQQRKKVFVLCSSAVSPKLVERGHLRSKEIKAALGEKLGRAILTPILAGNTAGLSYCLFPYCQTLHTNKIAYWLQRKLLTAGILDWLNQAAAITASDVTSSSDLQDDFITPLSHLSKLPKLPSEISLSANHALDMLQSKEWKPRYTFTHGDLWVGNVLLDKSGYLNSKTIFNNMNFVFIDWAGASLKGHPFNDFIRIARSLSLSKKQCSKALHDHCQAVGCSREESQYYLLASFGYLGLNLEHFPTDRFVASATKCTKYLQAIIQISQ